MIPDEMELRGRFKERILPLLPILAQTARFVLGDDAAADRALEESIANAYSDYHGDVQDRQFRLWIFEKVMGDLTRRDENGVSYDMNAMAQASRRNPSTSRKYDGDADSLRMLRVRVKFDLNSGDVREVAGSLPTGVRAALALSLTGAFTSEEMAPVLKMPPAAVRAHLNAGRQLMRQGLCDRLKTRPVHQASQPMRFEQPFRRD